MFFYESPSTDPYENLALEEYLFETLPAGEGLLMLWQNRDAVIVGKYQNTAEEINAAYVRDHCIAVVRRLSGGGAVYHDLGGLNYTLITDEESPADGESGEELIWQKYMTPVLSVLAGYGLKAEFSGRNDILIEGKKIAGCAQYARGGRMLHHGCILFDSDLSKVSQALSPGEAKFVSKSDKSVASRVTTICACLATADRIPDVADFRADLREAYRKWSAAADTDSVMLDRGAAASAGGTLHGAAERFLPYELSDADLAAVRKLQEEKYSTWEWNFGFRGDYQVRRQRKFPAGLVTAEMDARQGYIKRVRFSGDFFSEGEVAALEEALKGIALDEHLADYLADYFAGSEAGRIRGVSARELADLLTG